MRILLIGEYSRLHNSLKEALVELGHQVTIVGNGDGFKNYPVDHNIDAKWSKSGLLNTARQAVYRIFGYDFAGIEYGLRFWKLLPRLKGFDVVQLVSETPIHTTLSFELYLLRKIRAQNGKMFVLCSGADVPFTEAASSNYYRYSLLDPYHFDKSRIEEYKHVMRNLTEKYREHHEQLYAMVEGAIATDVDYKIALQKNPKYLGMIPNPINTDKVQGELPPISGQIVIFHGINRWNYHKKGNVFFEEALLRISDKYGNAVRIITVDTVPYAEYIKLYDQAHILLDQVYAYDQGYNALEAMARGKVVFTGAEKEFMQHYNLSERVAVNALPDVESIVNELSFLIENPEEIQLIGQRAKQFIEREHHYLKIARKYLEAWESK